MTVKRLVIHGAVQGVGFRYGLANEARQRNVTGWVRNRRDGTVEAVISGETGDVEAVLAWARRGPPAAHVARVDVTPAEGSFSQFEQRPTE